MSLFLVVVGIKVFELQYIKGDKYKKLAEESTIKNDTIFANKGNVYAADGNLLATSISNYTIRMDVISVDNNVFVEMQFSFSRCKASHKSFKGNVEIN